MLNGMLGFLIGFILFILIVLAILYHQYIKNFRNVLRKKADERAARKQAEEDAYFKRTSTKHYREEEKPDFKKDYFKGTGTEARTKAQQQRQQKPRPEEPAPRRTVETDGGVSIIDDRGKRQADRKIFNDTEGEYVDFEEVSD